MALHHPDLSCPKVGVDVSAELNMVLLPGAPVRFVLGLVPAFRALLHYTESFSKRRACV